MKSQFRQGIESNENILAFERKFSKLAERERQLNSNVMVTYKRPQTLPTVYDYKSNNSNNSGFVSEILQF